MEQMASRPFAGVVVQLSREQCINSKESSYFKCDNNPTPIALEPCSNGKAAVLSLIIRLPTGGTGYAPPGNDNIGWLIVICCDRNENVFCVSGQTGLAIASSLVSLGNVPLEQKCNNKDGDGFNNKVISNSSAKFNGPNITSLSTGV